MSRTATRRRPAVVRHLPEIDVTVISRWLFNCYVIHDGGDGRPVVVDLGMPSQIPVVEQALAARGQRLDDLAAVIATHGHADHVGGIPALLAATQVPVHLPATLGAMLDGRVPLRSPGPREIARIHPLLAEQPRDLGTLRELAPLGAVIGYTASGIRFPVPRARWMADGDVLAAAPAWTVLHRPGHTDDSTCLLHAPTRTLISGDAVLSIDGRAWINPEYVDAEATASSERLLRSVDVEHLLPGHGRPLTGADLTAHALGPEERPIGSSIGRSLWRLATDHARRTQR